jgi:pyridoxamine 5'-phosphate oxidase
MHLATANNSGKVSCRAVLLKGFDEKGFVFYTNYQSSKAADLEENNNAAITFLWMELFRQVRIEGTVQKVSSADSDIYFASRPRQSQIGAISSAQSKILNTRDELDKNYKEIERQYIGKPIPRPQNWGGYCIVPQKIEFWQGRSSRLHDRILYTKDESDKWIVSRLFP